MTPEARGITASFISWAGDAKDAGIADWIRSRFYDAYKSGFFTPQSYGELLVYSDPVDNISGWSRPARIERAKAIAKEIAAGTSTPPPAGSPAVQVVDSA
jgi:hypothetical protein